MTNTRWKDRHVSVGPQEALGAGGGLKPQWPHQQEGHRDERTNQDPIPQASGSIWVPQNLSLNFFIYKIGKLLVHILLKMLGKIIYEAVSGR